MNDLPKIFGEEQIGSKERWNGLPSTRALVLLFSIVFFAIRAAIAAQTGASVPVPVRDPLAIQRLNLALAALGGAQNVSRMDSCVEEATRTSRNHFVNRGVCVHTSMSAALSASTAPLHAPTVGTPTVVHFGASLTHIS